MQAVLPAGSAPTGAVRRVVGIVLNKHREGSREGAAKHEALEGGKRKRRAPAWMSGAEWTEEDLGSEEAELQPRRRTASVSTVAASTDDGRGRLLQGASAAEICVWGVAPPARVGERSQRRERSGGGSMPPPLHVPHDGSRCALRGLDSRFLDVSQTSP